MSATRFDQLGIPVEQCKQWERKLWYQLSKIITGCQINVCNHDLHIFPLTWPWSPLPHTHGAFLSSTTMENSSPVAMATILWPSSEGTFLGWGYGEEHSVYSQVHKLQGHFARLLYCEDTVPMNKYTESVSIELRLTAQADALLNELQFLTVNSPVLQCVGDPAVHVCCFPMSRQNHSQWAGGSGSCHSSPTIEKK